MREKLIKLLSAAGLEAEVMCIKQTDCDKCPNAKNGCQLVTISDYLVANGVTIQEWIPVSERLPEDWCPVLVMVREVEMPLLGSYRENVWFHEKWNTTFINGAVTHWMPMPPPPGEV